MEWRIVSLLSDCRRTPKFSRRGRLMRLKLSENRKGGPGGCNASFGQLPPSLVRVVLAAQHQTLPAHYTD
jgi:hypothetical protein